MSDAGTPLFRASKRRKTSTAPKLSHRPGHQSESDPESDNEQSTDLVKSRIQVKNRQRPSGMRFSNASVGQSNADGHNHESMALVPVTEAGENKANAHGLDNRFVVSGMGVGRDVVENDPNMYVISCPFPFPVFWASQRSRFVYDMTRSRWLRSPTQVVWLYVQHSCLSLTCTKSTLFPFHADFHTLFLFLKI